MSGEVETEAGATEAGTTGERALVLVPIRRDRRPRPEAGEDHDDHVGRDAAGRVAEAVNLARAIGLDVVDGLAVPLANLRPATLLGEGKVEELRLRIETDRIGLVIVDHPLTPNQQRNLEKAWKAKVIDRTGLILEIFGERAQTREGRLQVEHAHLTYQKGRLVRSWTHLERQRGGFGFLGGPGETQIEADRRQLEERITRIERDLEQVVRTRRLQRENRKRTEHPVVALVGYTNAGKSTLFNALTHAGRLAEDMLFATLDPSLRQIRLPHGSQAVLSDTVGFVSNLPTQLVAAFRATLEEVVEADLILHIRDVAHPETAAQASDVAAVLEQLEIDIVAPERVIEVWNKIDLLPPDARPNPMGQGPEVVAVSALTSEGIPALLEAIEARLFGARAVYRVRLAGETLQRLHELYGLGEVLERTEHPDGSVDLAVRVGDRAARTLHRAFPDAQLTPRGAAAPGTA